MRWARGRGDLTIAASICPAVSCATHEIFPFRRAPEDNKSSDTGR